MGIIAKLCRRLGRAYAVSALVILNAALLYGAANLLAWYHLPQNAVQQDFAQQDIGDKWIKKYSIETLRKIYPGKTDGEIRQIVRQTAVLPFVFEPYIHFKTAPRVTPYFSVDKEGFRLVGAEQGPWPPKKSNYNIFVFGGSTTFGAGVPDAETIPAYIQQRLGPKAKIYNFGTGAYYSTQERIFFEKVLEEGFVPDSVIFIDGLNDFYSWDDVPATADRFKWVFDDVEFATIDNFNYFAWRALRDQPALVWLRDHFGEATRQTRPEDFQNRIFGMVAKTVGVSVETARTDPSLADARHAACEQLLPEMEASELKQDDPDKLMRVIDRYRQNKKIIEGISREFGIKPYFVWQPIPTYHYDRCLNPFASDIYEHARSRFGYPMMAHSVAEKPLGEDFIWCADIQPGLGKAPLYIDNVHYTAFFSDQVARCIVDHAHLQDDVAAVRR